MRPANVEVHVGTDPFTWLDAAFVDFDGSRIRALLQDGSEHVLATKDMRPRRPRAAWELATFAPAVGDVVEMQVTSPRGWRLATVRARQGSAYLLRPHNSMVEVLRTMDKLRPRSPGAEFVLAEAEVPVDSEIRPWLASPSGSQRLGTVQAVAVQMVHQRGAASAASNIEHPLRISLSPGQAHIRLVGSLAAVEEAQSLVRVMLQNQEKVQSCLDAQRLRDKALEQREKKLQADAGGKFRKEFPLPASQLGRFIGRGGQNVKALEANFGIKVQVDNRAECIVTLSGDDEAKLNAAVSVAEVVEETLEVEPELVPWVVGHNFSALRALQSASGISECQLDRSSSTLVFTGTRAACLAAKELFACHMSYCGKLQDLRGSLSELQSQSQEAVKEAEAQRPLRSRLQGAPGRSAALDVRTGARLPGRPQQPMQRLRARSLPHSRGR